MQVVHTVTLEGFAELEMLQLAACLERCSSHPLAAVIVGHAAARHLQLDAAVSDSQVLPGEFRTSCLAFKQQHANGCYVHYVIDAYGNRCLTVLAGLGLTGIVAGHQTAVGNSRLMAQECEDAGALEAREEEWAQKGSHWCAELLRWALHRQTPCNSSYLSCSLHCMGCLTQVTSCLLLCILAACLTKLCDVT